MKKGLVSLILISFMVTSPVASQEKDKNQGIKKSKASELRAKRKKQLRAIMQNKPPARTLVIKQNSNSKMRKKDNFNAKDIALSDADKRSLGDQVKNQRKKDNLRKKIEEREKHKANLIRKRRAMLARVAMERRKILEDQKAKLIENIKDQLTRDQNTDAANSLNQLRIK